MSKKIKLAIISAFILIGAAGAFFAVRIKSNSLQEIDETRVELSLKAGMSEVTKAIALRDRIVASGRNWATDPIPEFEEHLPIIKKYYSAALKTHPQKLAILNTVILKDVQSFFKKKQLTLGKWNGFHLLLNQLLDTKETDLSKQNWRSYSSYDFFDKFLCFVYSNEGKIGIQTRNYADANNVWVLPMPTDENLSMYNDVVNASDFTNAIPFYRGAFGTKLNAGKLAAIYARIEEETSLRERAVAHLALYLLLGGDTSSTYEYIDSGEDILKNAREQFLDTESQTKQTVKDIIYSSLKYTNGFGEDIEIKRLDDTLFSVVANSRTFAVTLENDQTLLSFVNSKNKTIRMPLALENQYGSPQTRQFDKFASSLAKSLHLGLVTEDKASALPILDAFLEQYLKQ